MHCRLGFAFLAVALATGCVAPRGTVAPPLSAQARQDALTSLSRFSFDGRAAISLGDRGTQASLSWAQQGGDSRLRLSGPFGAGAMRVTLEDGELSLANSRGEHLSGAAADTALAAQLGFTPPFGALRYWLLGIAAPGEEAIEDRDAEGRLARLTQLGWQVDYQEYRPQASAQGQLAMPRRLRATRDDLDLRLVIDRWTIGR